MDFVENMSKNSGFAGSSNLVVSFPPGDRGKQLFIKHGML